MRYPKYAVILALCLAAVSGCYLSPAPEPELALIVELPKSLTEEKPTEEIFVRIRLLDLSGVTIPIHGSPYYEAEIKNFDKKKKGNLQLRDLPAGSYALIMEVGYYTDGWEAAYVGEAGPFAVAPKKTTVLEIRLEKKNPAKAIHRQQG